ncbi:MAG: serine/threonine-protein kinase, partial [Acidobacteriota bacterium]
MRRSDDRDGSTADPALTPTQAASPETDPTLGAPAPAASPSRGDITGYALGALIGRGGMGEVVVARDERIGRDVALKRMRVEGSPDALARFLREARIQARLEHPAIVPVHEIARDAAGQPYFTMKRIGGRTLGELLAASPPAPLQRLLRAFIDVCNAVEFAHSHEIVHRDLKPANVMLGDFGEVYVIDWGLARFAGERDAASVGSDLDSLDGATQVGAVLGTPGYMAPEQLHAAADVGPAADVYALGSILFEILAREPLHPRGAALQSMLAAIDPSPAARRPDANIPPELDALCASALARDPAARPTAAQLGEQVERYLDGDRDLEARRALAATWLARARAAIEADDIAGRAEAMRLAGRALALDPASEPAAELVTRL